MADDADMKAYCAFMDKYYPSGDKRERESLNVVAYIHDEIMSELIRRCGADLSRKSSPRM